MNRLSLIVRYFNTLKYLKWQQIYYRLLYNIFPLNLKMTLPVKASLNSEATEWNGSPYGSQSLFSSGKVIFLGEEFTLQDGSSWNAPEKSKLWLYNLHYFDDLTTDFPSHRAELQHSYIEKWITENPVPGGNGWEPYPTSLRLVNWLKWCSSNEMFSEEIIQSIDLQTTALLQRLEHHILGNHLFANAKALVFVGAFINSEVSRKALVKGLFILNQQLREQFLDDGGHFERSPMYHSILLWDLLDLIELAEMKIRRELSKGLPEWRKIAEKALCFLAAMIHNDGEISFFNDAAFGIAPEPRCIFQYASKLGLEYDSSPNARLIQLVDSGYSRITFPDYSLIFDHAAVGPDYLPGHAHADTLSFELSLGKHRLFVNSGTSLYGTSAERQRQRGTLAHNTVEVNGGNSSEVWGGFRVARRAKCKLTKASWTEDFIELEAEHQGYSRIFSPNTHKRSLSATKSSLKLMDEISNRNSLAILSLHLHPDVEISSASDFEICLIVSGKLVLLKSANPIKVLGSTWHPYFGASVANKKLEVSFKGHNEVFIQFSKVYT